MEDPTWFQNIAYSVSENIQLDLRKIGRNFKSINISTGNELYDN